MIKHIVMFKLKEYSESNAIEMRDVLLSMKGKIDYLVDISAGADFLREGRSYDVVLECVFKSKEDLDAYQNHPVHIPVKDYIRARISGSCAVDYEF